MWHQAIDAVVRSSPFAKGRGNGFAALGAFVLAGFDATEVAATGRAIPLFNLLLAIVLFSNVGGDHKGPNDKEEKNNNPPECEGLGHKEKKDEQDKQSADGLR